MWTADGGSVESHGPLPSPRPESRRSCSAPGSFSFCCMCRGYTVKQICFSIRPRDNIAPKRAKEFCFRMSPVYFTKTLHLCGASLVLPLFRKIAGTNAIIWQNTCADYHVDQNSLLPTLRTRFHEGEQTFPHLVVGLCRRNVRSDETQVLGLVDWE